MKKSEINWKEVQDYYNLGNSIVTTAKQFKISTGTLHKAKLLGLIVVRSAKEAANLYKQKGIKRSHSEETKKLLSEKRKSYLAANPDKRAWQTKEYHKSIGCEKLKEFFNEKGIKFAHEYEPLAYKGRYFSIDIAFPDKKIGIDVNGRQHYNSDGSLAPYYQNRHNLITEEGWILYEIPYHRSFIKEVRESLLNIALNSPSKVYFDFENYVPKASRIKRLKNFSSKKEVKTKKVNCDRKERSPHPTVHKYPSDTLLKFIAPKLELNELVYLTGIPQKALWYHLNKKGIKSKKIDRRRKYVIPPKERSPVFIKPNLRKVKWPSKEELSSMVLSLPITLIGEQFGVSDNCIRKWCKKYNIKIPYKRGDWTKIKAGLITDYQI